MNNSYALPADMAIEMTKKYGSPLYVFDEDKFRDNYIQLFKCIKDKYQKYNIAYSYKTNYAPYICKIVKELGGYSEVVSGMEYKLARKIGYDYKNIIFNGPVKGDELYEHLDNGGIANIDNLDELKLVVKHASLHSEKKYELAFRVNINIGQSFVSRFGIDDDNGDLETAFKIVSNFNNIEVVGLHCHIGRSRNLEAWQNRVNKMFDLVDKFFDKTPKFIDLGSGMNSVMEPFLANQFSDKIPTYKEYADIIGTSFSIKYGHLPFEQQPELITEPGTTLISGYISFLTTVKSVRTVKKKEIITIDGSIGNTGDICDYKQLPMSVIKLGNNKNVKNANIVGYTCLEADVLYRDFSGNISVGDIIEFRNVGSYSNVFKPPFIYPNCAMISKSNNYGTKIIKRKETMDDVFTTYIF